MEYVLFGIVIVAAFVAGGVMLRPAPSAPSTPMPFGLKAFEAHGLAEASNDVIKAVVATISFLGHPFTVVEEAKDAMSRAQAREDYGRRQIAENMKEIAELQEANNSLDSDALASVARANQLVDLIQQVSSVAGS